MYNPAMTSGPHRIFGDLSQRLLHRWVPKWHGAFCDPAGGFHERLGRSFKPLPLGYKRLLTQCRQLAMYAHASTQRGCPDYRDDLAGRFAWMVRTFHAKDSGGWRFSVDEAGNAIDSSYDFYAHAFVIFALSHYYRASGDELARALAAETRDFIVQRFRVEKGFCEALDADLKPMSKMRRHESHMHCLEACLAAWESWQDPADMNLADELVALFFEYFYPAGQGLREYYTDDLKPHPESGHVTEPGHYYEWIWLLQKHARLKGHAGLNDAVCAELLNWANRHGWDGEFGGIYDELYPDGRVLTESKRLWPFTEGIKANALMLDAAPDRQGIKDFMDKMVRVFRESYMEERGFWVEWLNRDLSPATDYMPGTTPYHVYFGIMETFDALERRGRAKSWLVRPARAVYALRRRMSGVVRNAVKKQ